MWEANCKAVVMKGLQYVDGGFGELLGHLVFWTGEDDVDKVIEPTREPVDDASWFG